jgi:ring-1,2-phenylacetyl-CoA epoxidase subunit PaaE
MSIPHFHELFIKQVSPEAAGAVAILFAVPPGLLDAYTFLPGQFLTLRANVNGTVLRRSYSICSSVQRFTSFQEIEIGVKPVAGGVFSNWAVNLQPGDVVEVMMPQGRFSPRPLAANTSGAATQQGLKPGAQAATCGPSRVAFVAGSGITPVLSIIASSLHSEPDSRFTLVYANQSVKTIMFNEALQDLKDQYPARLALIHVLSRQAQEVPLLAGRLDENKVTELINSLLPAAHMDEVFICGPEGMIDATEKALLAAGLARAQIHTERFFSAENLPSANDNAIKNVAARACPPGVSATNLSNLALKIVLDGKTHQLAMSPQDKVLDVALAAGLDLPFACRGGVCCTCRARVLEGRVEMEKNFTLEQWEIDKGFVLTCQARPLSSALVVSFDER